MEMILPDLTVTGLLEELCSYGSDPLRSTTQKSKVVGALLCSDTAMTCFSAGPSFRARIAPSRSTETASPLRTAIKCRLEQSRITTPRMRIAPGAPQHAC